MSYILTSGSDRSGFKGYPVEITDGGTAATDGTNALNP